MTPEIFGWKPNGTAAPITEVLQRKYFPLLSSPAIFRNNWFYVPEKKKESQWKNWSPYGGKGRCIWKGKSSFLQDRKSVGEGEREQPGAGGGGDEKGGTGGAGRGRDSGEEDED